jgi:hypothetical protein
MHTEVFWKAVYWFSLPALAILTLILLRRKLVKKFPFFFSYVVAVVLVDLARLLTLTYRGLSGAYYYVYFISDGVSTILALFAAGEVVLGRLFPRFHRVKLYRYLSGISGAIVAVAVVFTAANNTTVFTQTFVFLPTLIRTLHTIDFLRVVLLLFFLILMFLMGRQWGGYELGIAFGLGVNAAGLLTTFTILTKYISRVVHVLPAIAYDTACVIWLITFLHRERPEPAPVTATNPEVIQQARQWEDILKKSIPGKTSPISPTVVGKDRKLKN